MMNDHEKGKGNEREEPAVSLKGDDLKRYQAIKFSLLAKGKGRELVKLDRELEKAGPRAGAALREYLEASAKSATPERAVEANIEEKKREVLEEAAHAKFAAVEQVQRAEGSTKDDVAAAEAAGEKLVKETARAAGEQPPAPAAIAGPESEEEFFKKLSAGLEKIEKEGLITHEEAPVPAENKTEKKEEPTFTRDEGRYKLHRLADRSKEEVINILSRWPADKVPAEVKAAEAAVGEIFNQAFEKAYENPPRTPKELDVIAAEAGGKIADLKRVASERYVNERAGKIERGQLIRLFLFLDTIGQKELARPNDLKGEFERYLGAEPWDPAVREAFGKAIAAAEAAAEKKAAPAQEVVPPPKIMNAGKIAATIQQTFEAAARAAGKDKLVVKQPFVRLDGDTIHVEMDLEQKVAFLGQIGGTVVVELVLKGNELSLKDDSFHIEGDKTFVGRGEPEIRKLLPGVPDTLKAALEKEAGGKKVASWKIENGALELGFPPERKAASAAVAGQEIKDAIQALKRTAQERMAAIDKAPKELPIERAPAEKALEEHGIVMRHFSDRLEELEKLPADADTDKKDLRDELRKKGQVLQDRVAAIMALGAGAALEKEIAKLQPEMAAWEKEAKELIDGSASADHFEIDRSPAEKAEDVLKDLELRKEELDAKAEEAEMPKGLLHRAADWYNKQPTWGKYTLSAALFAAAGASAAVGGSTGAAIAAAAFIGSRTQRLFGGAALAVGIEARLQKKSETKDSFLIRNRKAVALSAFVLIQIGLPGMMLRGADHLTGDHLKHSVGWLGKMLFEKAEKVLGGHAPAPTVGHPSMPGHAAHAAGAAPVETGPVHGSPIKLAEAAAAPQPEGGNGLLDIRHGDNLWKVLDHRLQGAGTLKDLTPAQRNFVLASIENKLRAMSPEDLRHMGFGKGDIDKYIYSGDKLNLGRIFGDAKTMERILERAGVDHAIAIEHAADLAHGTVAEQAVGQTAGHAAEHAAGHAGGATTGNFVERIADQDHHGPSLEHHAADGYSVEHPKPNVTITHHAEQLGSDGSWTEHPKPNVEITHHPAGAMGVEDQSWREGPPLGHEPERNPFMDQWLRHHPGQKMSSHVYEELQRLGGVREALQPENFEKPEALRHLLRYDAFDHNYEAVRNVTVEEYLRNVPDPFAKDADPHIWQRIIDSAHRAPLSVRGRTRWVILNEDHLKLRHWLGTLPLDSDMRKLTIEEMAVVFHELEV